MSDYSQINQLEMCIEAILFVASGPVTINQLAGVLEINQDEVEKSLRTLDNMYKKDRGLGLQWHEDRVQLTTAPQMASIVERFLGLEATTRLSRPGLETLAIIAYRQPVTRPGIDAIRGVNSDGTLKSLLAKGLVQEMGRAESPGRPILYGVTNEFLQYFGLSSVQELPPFEIDEEGETNSNGYRLLKD